MVNLFTDVPTGVVHIGARGVNEVQVCHQLSELSLSTEPSVEIGRMLARSWTCEGSTATAVHDRLLGASQVRRHVDSRLHLRTFIRSHLSGHSIHPI